MAERWLVAADVAAIREGSMLPVVVAGRPLILVRRGPQVMAYEDACPHLHYPLSSGGVDGCEIVCFWHGAVFDLLTGAVLGGPAARGLRTFPVRLVAGRVEVNVISDWAGRSSTDDLHGAV